MRTLILAAVCTTFVASTAHAGSGNTIHIRQESPTGSSFGNTLSLDQSLATDSKVLGPSDSLMSDSRRQVPGIWPALEGKPANPEGFKPLELTPGTTDRFALQRGERNEATLKLTGYGGELQLHQDSEYSLPPEQSQAMQGSASRNIATATLAGPSLGAIIQQGQANQANLELTNATGLISQTGRGLIASLTVDGGNGQIIQVGDGSNAELSVMSGASATYTQIGSNLESVGSTAVEVFSTNPGSITITQTGF